MPVSYSLAGLSGELRLVEGQNSTLKRVGLGDQQSTITYNGRTLAAVDLNVAMGRHFDVSFTPVGSGLRADVTPGVEAAVYLGFGALPSEQKADPNFLDTTFKASFKAAAGPASIQIQPSDGSKTGSVQLVSGTLSLSTSQPGISPKSFTAGTCLGSSSSSGSHPVLDAVSSIACP